ncbi:MAG: beta-L-arabinofuranosidase domain-containing protein [Armatimonadota bacterium]
MRFILTTGLLASMSVSAMSDSVAAGKRVIEPMNYQGVHLDDGTYKRQFEEVCEYYLRIPNDDLLKPYRQRAGKDAPGADLGGCYVGHNPFGQFLAGFARMYAATGDRVYKDKAITLMNGWGECIEPDGFFFVEKNPQLIPYYYEKMVGGLLDIYTFCGDKRAIEYLDRITDWADKNTSRVRLYANPVTNDGGEWYTLSENLYRAYLLTGNKRYKDFAEVWEYKDYWDYFAQGKGNEIHKRPGWYHAYSHVNTFCGLGTGYLATGDQNYLKTLINAYDYLQEYQCWATGGYGPNEALLPREELVKLLDSATNHFETQCGSWAGFKMTKYLISFTGDARFGDWTEKLLINGIGASIPMTGDGRVFYYSEYNTGGSEKRNINAQWPCCTGTRPQAISDYHDIIYYKDKDDVYISQFVPSTLKMDMNGTSIQLKQRTKFPENDTVHVDVNTSAAAEFGIKVRAPGWLAGPMKAWINGEETDVNIDSKHWAVFNRTWSDGDTLKIRMPMKLWVSQMDKEKDYPSAIMYGPVAMAARTIDTNPAKNIDIKKIDSEFIPSVGDPLTWNLAAEPSILIKPFYAYKEGERYFLYLDPSKDINRTSYKSAKYSEGWMDFSGWMTATTAGASAEYQFTGKGIRIHYFKYDDAAKLEVVIDGKQAGIIDQYSPERGEAAFDDFTDLAEGKHTLRLILLPEKSEMSKGNFANVAAFEILK